MTESDYDGIVMKAPPEFIKYMQKYFPSACWVFKNKQSDKEALKWCLLLDYWQEYG